MAGSDGASPRLRAGGWLPDEQRDDARADDARADDARADDARPDEELIRTVGLDGTTGDAGAGADTEQPADVAAPDGPQWSDPPPWREETTWPEPAQWPESAAWTEPVTRVEPTTSTEPGKWTEPGGGRDANAGKNRGRWRSGQMLFRRRYNTAAVLTVVAVAAVLFLLATVLPVAVHNRTAATTAVGSAQASAAAVAPTVSFGRLAVEAESPDNTLIGSAIVGPYQRASGGQLVRAIGNWKSPKGSGALRFNNILVPASRHYVLTFYFVNIGGLATRATIITASGSKSMTVTVASNSVCCTSQQVKIYLFKGRNTITFSNPTGEAPAIDRIVITMQQ